MNQDDGRAKNAACDLGAKQDGADVDPRALERHVEAAGRRGW
jgi:hypothetical protein